MPYFKFLVLLWVCYSLLRNLSNSWPWYHESRVVELWTHDPKVVSSNPLWTQVLCPWGLSKALYSFLVISTQVYKWVPAEAGKITGSLCRGLATLSQQHLKLSSLAAGETEMGTSGCTEKCHHQFTFTYMYVNFGFYIVKAMKVAMFTWQEVITNWSKTNNLM